MSGIIAPRTYRPGDLIYEERAFAHALFKSEECETCHKRSPDLKSCSRCRKVKYCNKTCQNADFKDHKLECKHLKNLTEEYERYFVRLLGKVILKIKDKDWRSIQRRVLNTNVTFDDIGSYDTEREGNVRNMLFRKQMKELTRQYIGEQNMPTEEDFYRILGKVLLCHSVGRSYVSGTIAFVFLGLSKFEEECIPNANFAVRNSVLTVWASKEIRAGSDKITVKTLDRFPDAFIKGIDTLNNRCKCTDCTLPYGESLLSKIVDENRALPVICEIENLLNNVYCSLELPFHPSYLQVDELLRKQEGVLGDTHMLRLKLLELKCFRVGDLENRPERLREYFIKFEECTRRVFGEHSVELEPIYQKYIELCIQLGDFSEAAVYMNKFLEIATPR